MPEATASTADKPAPSASRIKGAPRLPVPVRDEHERACDFHEVALGYNFAQAREQAQRCLQCRKPTCVSNCPVSIDIPGFLKAVALGDIAQAGQVIQQANLFPAICGRVCPQESQCEKECVLAKKFGAVNIGALERFVADTLAAGHCTCGTAAADATAAAPPAAPAAPAAAPRSTGRKVAIIGSGPAGLAAAGDLVRLGHKVVVFEALHRAGGVLIYGIPEFRLPKAIVAREIAALEALGVEVQTNVVIGRTITIDELFASGYDAVFVGTGAGLPQFLNIPGESFCGVYSANEFLTRVNLMGAYDPQQFDTPVHTGKQVVVIGGGNVAMDAARVARRLGPEKVSIVYRRTRQEMPARRDEVDHAFEEGVHFEILASPLKMLGNEQQWVTALQCQRMELGPPDASGRRSPVPVPGQIFDIPADTIIVAIGNHPHPLIPATTPGIAVTARGNLVADKVTGQTPRQGLFAGGDIVTGAATVIQAMGAGRRSAKAIDQYLATLPARK